LAKCFHAKLFVGPRDQSWQRAAVSIHRHEHRGASGTKTYTDMSATNGGLYLYRVGVQP
jgi:hypothetical protein